MARLKNQAVSAIIRAGADAMNNIFYARITWPENLLKTIQVSSLNLAVRCQGFTPPSFTMGSQTIMYKGVPVKKPYPIIQGDKELKLSFRIDANYKVYQLFKEWQYLYFRPFVNVSRNHIPSEKDRGGIEVIVPTVPSHWKEASFGSEVNDIDEKPLGVTDDNTMSWKFQDVWVTGIVEPQYKQGDASSMNTEITFSFIHYTPGSTVTVE